MSEFWRDFLFWALGVWVGFFAGCIVPTRRWREWRAQLSAAQLEIYDLRQQVLALERDTFRNP